MRPQTLVPVVIALASLGQAIVEHQGRAQAEAEQVEIAGVMAAVVEATARGCGCNAND